MGDPKLFVEQEVLEKDEGRYYENKLKPIQRFYIRANTWSIRQGANF